MNASLFARENLFVSFRVFKQGVTLLYVAVATQAVYCLAVLSVIASYYFKRYEFLYIAAEMSQGVVEVDSEFFLK